MGVEAEAELVERWAAAAGRDLVDTDGQPLAVHFPGRCWGGPGPDFRGAVLRLPSGELLRGDVEVHRRASGWITHGHAEDAAYRDVVLHVVGRADSSTLDNTGRRLRTLELPASPAEHDPIPSARPCVRGPPADVAIAQAAQQRLLRKAERFRQQLASASPDQVLWHGVAEALGYTRNSAAMGRVADAVPWARAQTVLDERGPVGLTALLLGSAGLLPAATLAEAHAWRRFERDGARQALDVWAWRLVAVRSANHPVPRLRGLAALTVQWHTWLARSVSAPAMPNCADVQTGTRLMAAKEGRHQALPRRIPRSSIVQAGEDVSDRGPSTVDDDAPSAEAVLAWAVADGNAPAQRQAGESAVARSAGAGPHALAADGAEKGQAPTVPAGGLAALMLERVRQAAEAKRPRLWDLVAAGPWVGRGRAQVIVVNVLLPLARALGVEGVDALFARLPGEPSNRVSRYMADLLAEPGQRFASAQQQQGLLELFDATCASRWCERCDARAR
ncbi:MAG: DUF2851 family protein [Chloroflexi bacterium]|nr:DUF2851 family protein [Chloroflexota bacterium]